MRRVNGHQQTAFPDNLQELWHFLTTRAASGLDGLFSSGGAAKLNQFADVVEDFPSDCQNTIQ
jgi:hypothetical protein